MMAKVFERVSPEKYFMAANGTAIRSLGELEGALAAMGEDTFRFHVNSGSNHFAPWIRDVLGDETLASQVQDAAERKDMQILVLRKVVELLKNEAG